MKHFVYLVVIISGAYFYNMLPVVADKALTSTAKPVLTEKYSTYELDLGISSLNWTGSKPSGKHEGFIKIESGAMEIKNKEIKSGNFTLNMAGLGVQDDLSEKAKASLERHLRSPDFFDTEKFPTAAFELTGMKDIDKGQTYVLKDATHMMSGNLTMKGIKKNISFPAIISFSGDKMTAKASFNIDRDQWDVKYDSDNNYTKVAREINIKLDLTATKK